MESKSPSIIPGIVPTSQQQQHYINQHGQHINHHHLAMLSQQQQAALAASSHASQQSQQQQQSHHHIQLPIQSFNSANIEADVLKFYFPSMLPNSSNTASSSSSQAQLQAPLHPQLVHMMRPGNSGPSPPRNATNHYASPAALMATSASNSHQHQKSLPSSSHSPNSSISTIPIQSASLMTPSSSQHGRSHSVRKSQRLGYHRRSNHLQMCQSPPSGSGVVSNSPAASSPASTATILRATTLLPLLQRCIVILSGGRDRRGGPILTFPANSHADELPLEDLYLLVRYYTYLPEERVKKMGFTVVVDMRAGTTWHSVKPLLKVLDECIGQGVEITYIIKPEKFLEKQRASLSATKYNFEVMLVSVEHLLKELDVTQLTPDIGGTLSYNHKEWVHLRLAMEEFFTLAHDMSDKFQLLYAHMDRLAKLGEANSASVNVQISQGSGQAKNSVSLATQQQQQNSVAVMKAKQYFEEHKSLQARIFHAPVRLLERKAETLLHWLRYGVVPPQSPNQISWVAKNSDFQQLIPQVTQTVNQMYEQRDSLQKKWESEKQKLEQLNQLHMFKDDLGRMSVWLQQQRQLFLTEYLDIGQTASQAADLYSEHRQFLHNCSNVREQVVHLTSVARMLADWGHFASQQILSQAMELEHEWKSFTTALEDRSRVLQLSASFHARAEAFLANCPHWESSIRQLRGEDIPTLNRSMNNLQELWREAQTAHEEVCSDGRALSNHLSAPVPRGSHTSLTAAVDYSEGRRHCTDLVHELWGWYKRLELAHNDRRKRLCARLALLTYKEDVQQVLAWLREHGEPFLQRQVFVGKSVQRAEQLYNAHMQFEQVASNTLTNAEKLISAADDLAAQADDPEEILQEATGLQRRITAFTNTVRERRDTLDVACGFYGHVKELFAYFQRVRDCQNPGEHLPASIEGMEDELHTFHKDTKAMESAHERVCCEGNMLLERMRDEDEATHLRNLLQQVMSERSVANEIFTERQIRLDLCLQLRLLEADVSSAIHCLRYEVPPVESIPTGEDSVPLSLAGMVGCGYDDRELARLEESLAACQTACKIAEDVYQKGTELLSAFDQVQVNFPAGGPGSSDSGVGDSVEYAVERVQRMLQELQDFLLPVDHMKERFSLELEWRRDYEQSRNVLHWIRNGEALLHSTALIPGNLSEAEQLKAENEKFQASLNKAHPEVINSATRLEYLLLKCSTCIGGAVNGANGTSTSTATHEGAGDEGARLHKERRKESVSKVMEDVTSGWQSLVHVVEEKHKLLTTAVNWYKISDQVFSVLQSLEKDYRKEEEWCQNFKPNGTAPVTTEAVHEYMNGTLAKHGAQKESFLKACILARRTSEGFLKYLTRQPNGTTGKLQMDHKTRTTMSDLMNKEQAVLEAWANRKRRMDECMTYLNFKRDVEQLLSRVCAYEVAHKSNPGELERHKSSLEPVLRRLCEMAETFEFLFHGSLVKELMLKVKVAFPQFSHSSSFLTDASASPFMMGKSDRASINTQRTSVSSGIDNDSLLSCDSSRRGSSATIPSTPSSSSGNSSISTLDQKLMNRRENLLRELIHTEKTYVRDLKDCLNTYRTAMSQPATLDLQLPKAIEGREDTIFSNMRGIYEFHERQFLPELQKYAGDFLPEDVGHCFVTHAEKLADLYVEYCVNKTDSSQLLIDGAGNFFTSVQQKLKLTEPLQSYLIKPVQRITKYQLILRELLDCCDPGAAGELKEGMEAMLSVPKKANNALHLSMLIAYPDGDLSSLGEVLLQDEFTVWEPKQIIKKSHTRRVFLFDSCLILSKELSSLAGEHKKRYQYKSRLMLAEFNIKEHFEGDQCKFALWSGRVPPSIDYRLILRAPNLDTKQAWVRALREAIQERVFTVQFYSSGDPSGASGETRCLFVVSKDYKLGNFSVSANQRLEVLEHRGDQCLVRVPLTQQEGWMPCNLLTPVQPPNAQAPGVTRRSSTASAMVRKWLPNSTNKGVSEGVLKASNVSSQMATKSATDVQPTQQVAAGVAGASSTAGAVPLSGTPAGLLLMDDVSEESVEVELPPPMELQQDLPAVTAVAAGEAAYAGSSSGGGVDDSCSATETEETDQEEAGDSRTAAKKLSKAERDKDELGMALAKSLRSSQRMHLMRHNAKLEALSPRTAATGLAKMSLSGTSPSERDYDPATDAALTPGVHRSGSGPQEAGQMHVSPLPSYSDVLYSYNTMTSSTSSASAASSTLGHSSAGGGSGLVDSGTSGSGAGTGGSHDAVQQLWQRRWHALRELVSSEGVYVERLSMGMHFCRALERGVMQSVMPPSPELISVWPYIWGNWPQLTEWHSFFHQRLQFLLQQHEQVYQLAVDTLATSWEEGAAAAQQEFTGEEISEDRGPMRVPPSPSANAVTQIMDFTHEIAMANLFSDYAGRLRVMYSKYCDNLASRAQQAVNRHQEWFACLRDQLGVRNEDVASLLLQPVQRVLRYALHIQDLLRLARKLHSPPAVVEAWERAYSAMKAVPAKTQLIMEAARIDGYEGKICNLGDVRLSEDMRVSCLAAAGSTLMRRMRPQHNQTPTAGDSQRVASNLEMHRVFLFEQALLLTETVVGENGEENRVEDEVQPSAVVGDHSSGDLLACGVLAQCQYRYVTQIMVNKMRFHPSWPPTDGSLGLSGALCASLLQQVEDRSLCFAISDSTYGRDLVVLFAPNSAESRATWLRELTVMQRMQREIQQQLGKSSSAGVHSHKLHKQQQQSQPPSGMPMMSSPLLVSPSHHVPYSPPGPLFRNSHGGTAPPAPLLFQQYHLYQTQQHLQQQQTNPEDDHTPQSTGPSQSLLSGSESGVGSHQRSTSSLSNSQAAIDSALTTSTTSATSISSTNESAASPAAPTTPSSGKSSNDPASASKKKHNIFSIFNS